MRFGNYRDYVHKRCDDLGFEDRTEEVRNRTGVHSDADMGWDTNPEQAEGYQRQFKAVQMPIFVQIAGELHHKIGHKDVGLGKKNGGNNWTLPSGEKIATDIIVLKDLDGSGATELIDCFSSMGGPESKPRWDAIEPNSDREFIVPPVPGQVDPGPIDPPVEPPQQGLTKEEVQAMIDAALVPYLQRGDKVGLECASGTLLCAEGGGPEEAHETFTLTSRLGKGSWEEWRLV